MKASLVAITQPLIEGIKTPEELMVYCARVSSPNNQHNTETAPNLLRYCLKKGHWSVFEQVDMTLEIETSRAIAAQLLRHKSFSFQEFSLRYAASSCQFEPVEIRFKGTSNRQGSRVAETEHEKVKEWCFSGAMVQHFEESKRLYDHLIKEGVAPEVARTVLPLNLTTRLYMKGSVRSWIHYLQVRCEEDTQKEHRDLANEIKRIFVEQFPIIGEALYVDKKYEGSIKELHDMLKDAMSVLSCLSSDVCLDTKLVDESTELLNRMKPWQP